MPRPPGVQITRDRRKDGSVTFSLRVRISGADERVPLGNTNDGWDEIRAEVARKQLLAKIELGQWSPRIGSVDGSCSEEPTFRELATDWLEGRKRNPAIRPRTTELNESQLKRYLAPFFGELHPSEITIAKIKQYRERIHTENEQIRSAADSGRPLRDARNGIRLRTLSNESINKTLRTLALILDDAADAGWIERNLARERRMREPIERRRHRGILEVDEFLDLLQAAGELDSSRRKPATLERAAHVRALRDERGMAWAEVSSAVGVAPATAVYLYKLQIDPPKVGVRRAIIATLTLAGPRVTELCMLTSKDVDLAKARIHVADSKTEAGVRTVDIHPRLRDELSSFRASRTPLGMDAPAFPTSAGTPRNKDNVRQKVIEPVLIRANEKRSSRGEPPIRAHVTPHTLRRTYISYAIAAGFDIPYVQAQVGHVDPSVTLAVYAQVMRRSDRDELRTEIRELLGVEGTAPRGTSPRGTQAETAHQHRTGTSRLRASEKAVKGRALGR
jgi:integrase